MAEGLSRRTVLHGLTASAGGWVAAMGGVLGIGGAGKLRTPYRLGGVRSDGGAFDRMQNVGGAVAVVSADQAAHVDVRVRGLGPQTGDQADVFRWAPTKSMTAALVATYVDDGRWAGTRGRRPGRVPRPTDELTRSLRVRDLLGMGRDRRAGSMKRAHFDSVTAAQLLQSVVNLPGSRHG